MDNIKYSSVNETIYYYKHSSGINVYIVEKPGFSKSTAYFATHYGSIDNYFAPVGQNEMIEVPDGIAHFLEHKMFEQPDNSNVFDMFSKYGAYANAFTSFNMTAYYFWCTNYFKENLKTLVNFVQTPYFTDENVAKEQGIIGQEIRMYEDNPNWRCYFNMLQGLYVKHPVSRDIAGTIDSISKITKETLYTCYNTFYHPSNMTICMIGDFNHEDISDYLNSILKPIPKTDEVKRSYPQEPAEVAKRDIVQKLSVSRPLYCIGFKDNTALDKNNIEKRRLEVNIALNMLMGKSSALYNDLYEKGLITPSFGFDYSGEESYAFTEISDECDNIPLVIDSIEKAITNYKPSQDDFERTKRKLFGKSLYIFDDPEEYVSNLARHMALGLDMYKQYELFDKVTAKDIENVIKTHLAPENMVVSIVENK